MKGKHLIAIADFSRDEVLQIFEESELLKGEMRQGIFRELLKHRTLAMIFEKPSARTRMSFEVGVNQLGGKAMYISKDEIKMGVRESIADVARTTCRYADAVMIRTFAHATILEFAKHATVPVVNGLSDYNHPCQGLADLFTFREKTGGLAGKTLAFVGDGNNVARSLAVACVKLGVTMRIASPPGYELSKEFLKHLAGLPEYRDGIVKQLHDAGKAVAGADAVYTDVWASMGQEAEAEARKKAFAAYQVNAKLMKQAAPEAVFLHCLPARRGEEVTDEVIDGPQSAVFDQAENRMHVQKGVIVLLMGAEG
ncbi:MAG: ornithine carbamoyltransferase [Planctomycetota bacterium]